MSKGIVILLCIVAVIIGSMVGMAFNMGILGLGQKLIPYPDHLNPSNMEDIKTYVKDFAPMGAFLYVLLAHWGQAFFGGIVAALIAPSNKLLCAMIVGVLTLVGGIMNMFMIPAPTWFNIVDILGYLPFAYLAAQLVGNRDVKANN